MIQESISETQITVVEENLGALNQLAQIAEQEFAALVQSQFELVEQLTEIKNNIRINSFKAKFSQVVSSPADEKEGKKKQKKLPLKLSGTDVFYRIHS